MNRIYLSPPHVGPEERQLLLDAFDSNWIAPLGPHVDAFEQELSEYVGVEHVAALSSGTAALHLAMLVLGIERGDEVLCSSLTFSATVNAITYVGAHPVFLDSNMETWNMAPALLEEELEDCARKNRLPKAVIAVDIYGQCADYDAIFTACERYEVALIEDAAEALGATYRNRRAGSFGDLSILSFNGNKIITTSGGGALLSSNGDWIARARHLATQAREPALHYEHTMVGYNYRMSNLLAAVGRGQLRWLDEKVTRRRAINRAYHEGLADTPGIEFMPEAAYGRATCWLTCIVVDQAAFGASRNDLLQSFEKANIEARPVWKPMHLQPVFARYRKRGGEISADLFERGICLPSGSNLSGKDIERVIQVILDQRRRR